MGPGRHPWTGFLAALKGAAACDVTRLGAALKRALDALHLQRLAAGTDAWGLGYQPAGVEPTVLLLLTDGTELTSLEGVAEARGPFTMGLAHPPWALPIEEGQIRFRGRAVWASGQAHMLSVSTRTANPHGSQRNWSHRVDGAQALVLPPGPTLGSELAAAPYRWDQRLFGALLRMPALDAAGAPAISLGSGAAAAAAAEVPATESTVAALCEVRTAHLRAGTVHIMGGRPCTCMLCARYARRTATHFARGTPGDGRALLRGRQPARAAGVRGGPGAAPGARAGGILLRAALCRRAAAGAPAGRYHCGAPPRASPGAPAGRNWHRAA